MKKIYTSKTTFDAYMRYPDNYYEVEKHMEEKNMEQKYILFNGDLYDRDKDFKIAKILNYTDFTFCNKLFLSGTSALITDDGVDKYNSKLRWNDLVLIPKVSDFNQAVKRGDDDRATITGGIQELEDRSFIVDDEFIITINKDFETSGKITIQILGELVTVLEDVPVASLESPVEFYELLDNCRVKRISDVVAK